MPGSEFYGNLMFWIFAIMAVAPGLGILLCKDIVRQAFWLLLSLAGFAGLYFTLEADFLGFTQVVVYIGGILILFLFGVMLTHRMDIPLKDVKGFNLVLPGIIAAGAFLASIFHLIYHTQFKTDGAQETPTTIKEIGEMVMSEYLLPFEVVSVVLLVALVGATYIARRGDEEA